MIDLFALGLSQGLIALAAWRLLWRDDLDRNPLPDRAALAPAIAASAKRGSRARTRKNPAMGVP
jgi:hypothetical protein